MQTWLRWGIWPYIRSFGCAKRLAILIQSVNLASTVAILDELVALGAQTDIIIDFTLLQKPVCGPVSVVTHPSIHTSVHPFMHAAVHSSIHVSIYPSIHPSIHLSIHTCIHASVGFTINVVVALEPWVTCMLGVAGGSCRSKRSL